MKDAGKQLYWYRYDLEPRVTAWSIDAAEGMPGQTLVVRRPGMKLKRSFSWEYVWIEQGAKKFDDVEIGSDHAIGDFKQNMTWVRHYVFLPHDLEYGPAKLHVDTGVIPIRIVSREVPPLITDLPRLTAHGWWMIVQARQLIRYGKNQYDPDIKLILEQGGRSWQLEWFLAPAKSRDYEAGLAVCVPKDAQEGRATLKVVQRGLASEPADLCIVDGYYLPDPYASVHVRERKGLHGELKEITAGAPADAYRLLAEFPDGTIIPWVAERGPSAADQNTPGLWRIPSNWPIGYVTLPCAHLQGDVWHLEVDRGESFEILSKPPAPVIRDARFISRPYRLSDTVELKRGSLLIAGEGIAAGERCVVIVRWESRAELKFETHASDKDVWFTELPSGSTCPDIVRIARVANGVVGDFAEGRVEMHGDIRDDRIQDPRARESVKWLRNVREHVEPDQPPPLPELLRKLNLTRLPLSPYGGTWTYVPTPGRRSYTFLAFDPEGVLKLQLHEGGPSPLFVQYDALRESNERKNVGKTRDNLLWVAPWDEGGVGNVVADAARAATGADIGIYNPSGLCGNFPKGGISAGMIEYALPYDDELVLLRMTDADLAALFQEAAQPNRFTLRFGTADQGPRVHHSFRFAGRNAHRRTRRGHSDGPNLYTRGKRLCGGSGKLHGVVHGRIQTFNRRFHPRGGDPVHREEQPPHAPRQAVAVKKKRKKGPLLTF
ncbi:MAG: hypothetical protein A3G34_14890 [Candidatus Lindowbacteria bacterium RIFCSPLOWO2_12_FULL_62_27]|nr:MAG: hypothetical protein A3G34_14890 [Candidatus Lindowbacteria bacterium RIFCSPLOWO2_12_FULL_62_27]